MSATVTKMENREIEASLPSLKVGLFDPKLSQIRDEFWYKIYILSIYILSKLDSG